MSSDDTLMEMQAKLVSRICIRASISISLTVLVEQESCSQDNHEFAADTDGLSDITPSAGLDGST